MAKLFMSLCSSNADPAHCHLRLWLKCIFTLFYIEVIYGKGSPHQNATLAKIAVLLIQSTQSSSLVVKVLFSHYFTHIEVLGLVKGHHTKTPLNSLTTLFSFH